VPGTAIVLVPVSAVLTVVAIRALRGPPVHRPRAVVAGVLVGAAAVTIVLVWTRPDDDAPVAAPTQDGSLLLMAGINSSSGRGAMGDADPGALGYDCAQPHYFSYAGPRSGQPRGDALCPIRTGAPFGAPYPPRPPVEPPARRTGRGFRPANSRPSAARHGRGALARRLGGLAGARRRRRRGGHPRARVPVPGQRATTPTHRPLGRRSHRHPVRGRTARP